MREKRQLSTPQIHLAKFGFILSAMMSRIAILLLSLGFTHAAHTACNPMTEVLEVPDLIVLEPARMNRAPGTAIKSRLELKDSTEIRNYLGWKLEPDRPAAN